MVHLLILPRLKFSTLMIAVGGQNDIAAQVNKGGPAMASDFV